MVTRKAKGAVQMMICNLHSLLTASLTKTMTPFKNHEPRLISALPRRSISNSYRSSENNIPDVKLKHNRGLASEIGLPYKHMGEKGQRPLMYRPNFVKRKYKKKGVFDCWLVLPTSPFHSKP